ncbi:MAG: DUF4870 domain-containing protein [Patescibacteria group bacterium]
METPVSTQKDIEENKLMAVLGYLGILLLVPLLAKKDSPYAQFHAKQGLVLVIFGIALGIIAVIPFLGWIVSILGYLTFMVFWVMGIINAVSGKMTELPLIGQYAKHFNI